MAKDKGKKKDAAPEVETKKKGKKAPAAEPEKKSKGKKDKGGKATSGGAHGIQAPGSGGQFEAAAHVGKLLLITPHRVEEDIDTVNGKASATRAEIVVLGEKGKDSKTISDALIFQKVVQGQLREAVDSKSRVVGRLFRDEASKKKGQDAPYKLQAPTKAEIDVASKYLDSLDPLR